jgi:hypothetical protein
MLKAAHSDMHSFNVAKGCTTIASPPWAFTNVASHALRKRWVRPFVVTVKIVLLDEGQSRRRVALGPTMVVVATLSVDVGVTVGEGVDDEVDVDTDAEFGVDVDADVSVAEEPDNDCADVTPVVSFFEARAPPTPPAIAATTATSAMIAIIQNVLFLKPHIVRGWSCSWT